MSKYEEVLEKTASYRGYIYLGICLASFVFRAYSGDREGMAITMLVIPLCLMMIARES
jgi:hypothetical protein